MSSNPSSNRRSCAKGSICIVVFEAVLKTPATMAGHGERDRCARSSLLLSEPCCVSSHCRSPMPPRLTRYRGDNYCDTGDPDDGSRMTRECPVRFCERLGVKLPRPTHPWPPGSGNGIMAGLSGNRCRRARKQRSLWPTITAPLLDSTIEVPESRRHPLKSCGGAIRIQGTEIRRHREIAVVPHKSTPALL